VYELLCFSLCATYDSFYTLVPSFNLESKTIACGESTKISWCALKFSSLLISSNLDGIRCNKNVIKISDLTTYQ
jgi:hypothetical protein